MATKRRGFPGLCCPKCGAADGLLVRVATLDLECGDCGEPTTRAEVETLLGQWRRLLTWLDRAAEVE
jgi:Zn ribbon nucleic-acid-binding protein